ncbi:hypothetical protein R6Q57_001183 [Mikania cordata]
MILPNPSNIFDFHFGDSFGPFEATNIWGPFMPKPDGSPPSYDRQSTPLSKKPYSFSANRSRAYSSLESVNVLHYDRGVLYLSCLDRKERYAALAIGAPWVFQSEKYLMLQILCTCEIGFLIITAFIRLFLLQEWQQTSREDTGDGGDLPPHGNPSRIPTCCESLKLKKRRSRGRNLKLFKKFAENGKKPLPVQVDDVEGMFGFVGPNQSDFVRLISNQIWDEVPLCYKSWNDVPDSERSMIYPPLFDYFDLDLFRGTRDWGGIQAAITNECCIAYARKKSKLKKHFIKHGGYDDVEATINCPPPDYDVSNYHRAIDELFTTDESKKRSEKNKINRSKHRYPSYHGSESYKQKRWKEEKMKSVAAEMKENDFSDTDVDEILVIKSVLGNKRGHLPGVGRVG